MLVSLYRYNPETDNAPYMQDVDVELPAGKDLRFLTCLISSKRTIPQWPIVAHAVKVFAVLMA